MTQNSSWSRRQALKATGTGLLVTGLAGCSGNETTSDDGSSGSGAANDDGGGGPTQLEYLDRGKPFVETYPEEFNQSQNNYEINGRKVQNTYQGVVTQIQAGESPGDIIGLDVVQMGRFENLGGIAEIEDITSNLEYRDEMFDGVDPLFFEANEKEVAVPWWGDCSFYYYNKNHFEQVGLDPESPPETWTEFEEAAVALDEVSDDYPPIGFSFQGGLNEFFFYPFIWGNDGQIMNDSGDKAMIGETPAIEALEFWKGLSDEDYTTDLISTGWSDFHSLFAEENTSMLASGPYAIGYMEDNNQEMFENEEFGTALFPSPEGKQRSSFLGGNVATISPETKDNEAKFEAATAFLEWINSEEGLKVTQELGNLPLRPEGFEMGSYAEEPTSTYLETAKTALSQGNLLVHPKYSAITGEIQTQTEAALTGQKSPEQAYTDAAETINNDVLD